jgi:glycosyltransferase involved in cell wall biosynthesis
VGKTVNYSVIIPTIGRRSVLKSIESVIKQTVKPHQIVVVLNGNCNGAFILDEFKKDIQLYLYHKSGVSNARNLGMEKLNEDIDLVAFLDDDDTWLEDKMKLQIEFIKKHKLHKNDYWLVSSGAYVTYSKKQTIKRPKSWYTTSTLLSEQLYKFSWKRSSVYIPTPSWIVSRKVAMEIKFDPNLQNREDLSFLLDIESKNGKIYQINEFLSFKIVIFDNEKNKIFKYLCNIGGFNIVFVS